jgi:hypothetical protein
MRHFDVFNGDADGICALHQLRLVDPQESELVTGVKRDITLLSRVAPSTGDIVTVLDVSLDSNRADLIRVLDVGAQVHWFDHHFAGEIPTGGALEAHIDTASDVCTSLLVDRHLGGRYRAWAIVAAFGDGLNTTGQRMASEAGFPDTDTAVLARLGECLNYNAYGESVADLWFAPDALYRVMHQFVEPLAFIRSSPEFDQLDEGYRQDLAQAKALRPYRESAQGTIFMLPEAAWARRVIGVLANQLAQASPSRAHALLSQNSGGCYTVSVRAPVARPAGADTLCRKFATGGGRKAAAGINALPDADLDRFAAEFDSAFRTEQLHHRVSLAPAS